MSIEPQSRRAFIAMAGAAALAGGDQSAHAATAPDLVIKGGRVIDPASGIDAVRDVAISRGRIVAVRANIAPGKAQLLDARGKLVVPGLIDIHTHATVDPSSSALMLKDGVTGWVETGWQGAETVVAGVAAVKAAPQKAGLLLNIGRKGVMPGAGETMELSLADVPAARAAIAAHRDVVIGVKARLSRNITGDHDLEVLRRAQEATRPFGIPLMIHIGQTYTPAGKLFELLKPGDIVTHMYAPPPNAIIDADGKLIPEALSARQRGVKFDWGHGTRGHVTWEMVEKAVEQGFLPDTVSTDWTVAGSKLDINMSTIMSDMLSFGVPLDQVVAMATINAAKCFPLFRGRGTLAVGAPGDVALLELREGAFAFLDNANGKRAAARKLVAVGTVLGGKAVA